MDTSIFVALVVALVVSVITGFIFGEISSDWCVNKTEDALTTCHRTITYSWTVLGIVDVSSFFLVYFGKKIRV